MKLSIIVPVYNVEQYIRPCIDSIYKQGLSDNVFEVILVNDGTQDDSFGQINDLLEMHQNIHVIKQDNQGLSVARNIGMKYASGDYVLFVDSDDLLVENSLIRLFDQLSDNTVDLLIADFVKMTNEEINQKYIIVNEGNSILKSGKEAFLYDLDPRQCYVWRTIYKKSFLEKNKISFIPGIFFEDVPFTTECYLKADICIKSSILFYIYRQRRDSIVSSVNIKKMIDMNRVIERLWMMRKELFLNRDLDKKMLNLIYVTFSLVMWYLSNTEDMKPYRRKIIVDLKNRIPDLCFSGTLKQQIVSMMFRHAPYLYVGGLVVIHHARRSFS